MASDSLRWRKQFRVCEIAVICILSWLFVVVFALLVSSCTKQPAPEPEPEFVRAPVLMRRMQMETEDIMSALELQSANMVKRRIKTRIKPNIKSKLVTDHEVALKHKAKAYNNQHPVTPTTCCGDFELTVSRGDWTLHIAP